jgi:hypothetical protein
MTFAVDQLPGGGPKLLAHARLPIGTVSLDQVCDDIISYRYTHPPKAIRRGVRAFLGDLEDRTDAYLSLITVRVTRDTIKIGAGRGGIAVKHWGDRVSIHGPANGVVLGAVKVLLLDGSVVPMGGEPETRSSSWPTHWVVLSYDQDGIFSFETKERAIVLDLAGMRVCINRPDMRMDTASSVAELMTYPGARRTVCELLMAPSEEDVEGLAGAVGRMDVAGPPDPETPPSHVPAWRRLMGPMSGHHGRQRRHNPKKSRAELTLRL